MLSRIWQCLSVVLLVTFPATAALAKDATKATGDIEGLQGTWLADLEPGLQARLELNGGNLLYVHVRNQQKTVIWEGHFAINEKARPKQMDWTPLRRGNRNVPSSLAIYRLEGDLLLIVGDTEGPRPSAFYSGGGPHRPKTVIFRRAVEADSKGKKRKEIGGNKIESKRGD